MEDGSGMFRTKVGVGENRQIWKEEKEWREYEEYAELKPDFGRESKRRFELKKEERHHDVKRERDHDRDYEDGSKSDGRRGHEKWSYGYGSHRRDREEKRGEGYEVGGGDNERDRSPKGRDRKALGDDREVKTESSREAGDSRIGVLKGGTGRRWEMIER